MSDTETLSKEERIKKYTNMGLLPQEIDLLLKPFSMLREGEARLAIIVRDKLDSLREKTK